METSVLRISGMTCGGCVRSVTNVLKALPGVDQVDVSLEAASAVVKFDTSRIGTAAFKAAIEDAGFELLA